MAKKNQEDENAYKSGHYYVFRDKDGNTISSMGKNGYVWQSITTGTPLSINSKGEWYVEPYLEVTPSKIIQHTPSWFKSTPEYSEWKDKYSSYLQPGINKDQFNQLNDILKAYGGQGIYRGQAKREALNYGITDADLQERYFQNMLNLSSTLQGVENDGILLINGERHSVKELADAAKSASKNQLSDIMGRSYDLLNSAQGKEGSAPWGGTREEQEQAVQALSVINALNAVQDNYQQFGEEYKKLLEASGWQKFEAFASAANQGLLNSALSFPARLVHGGLTLIKSALDDEPGLKFDADISKYEDPYSARSGGGLRGTEGFVKTGAWVGTIEQFVTMYGVSMLAGMGINGMATSMSGQSAAVLSKLGTFMQTPIGAIASDFFLKDIPIDVLNFFTTASEGGWDWKDAWRSETREQNFIPIPIVGDIIPWKVRAGLMNDIIGDAFVDLSLPALGALGKITGRGIDKVTNNAATRLKEYVAVKNLELQQKLTDLPVLGKGWKKMMDSFMGAENAAFIREARKASIREGSMDAYTRAQLILTVKNRGGGAEVFELYKKALEDLAVLDDIKTFRKNAKNYGGASKTEVKWKTSEGGEVKNFTKTVDDVLPKDVKQGLLDIERLAELKGIQEKTGGGPDGIIFDPATQKEIEKLEARVEALPEDIKAFGEKMVEANRTLEQIAVGLGVTNEDWKKAMELDPQFQKYMTRQALVPGESPSGRVGSGEAPAQLTKSRKGYYAKNYLDPFVALNMKAQALGRAFSWHQQSKAVVAFQIAQGKINVGKSGVEAAEKLKEVKAKIAGVEATRKKVNYDGTLKDLSAEVDAIRQSVSTINTLLDTPNAISLKSSYTPSTPPAITEFVDEFSSGKIKYGDGAKDSVGLSDVDADYVIQNTYSMTAPDGTGAIAAADNTKTQTTPEHLYNEGIARDGTAYRYTVEDGVITSFKEITDPEAMANTIRRLGGVHDIDAATVSKMGVENTRAINRTILFYRDFMPNLPMGSIFRCESGSSSNVLGWIPGLGDSSQYNYRVVDGKIEADFPVYMAQAFYKKGNEAELDRTLQRTEASRFHPKNSAGAENVPIHENGHATMARLVVLRLNDKIAEGKISVANDTPARVIAMYADKEWDLLNSELAKRAFDKLGIEYNGNNYKQIWQKMAYNTISEYAGSNKPGWPAYQWETFSEAMVDFWANQDSASKFSLAIVEEMRLECQKYSMAYSPKKALIANDIPFKANLFKGDEWNFPKEAKSRKAKAQWLAKQRAANPFIKGDGLLSTDDYIKANQWDTFFKKEIESYDPNCKTSTPNKLVKKNGDFIEDLAKNSAKKLVSEIKKASVEGFDQRLAQIALGQHKGDTTEALNNFIISRINSAAEKIASKMDGGLTAENLNQARITLWQDDTVKRSMHELLSSLSPETSYGDVSKAIDTLFDQQAKGFASIEGLSVDYKNLNQEYIRYKNELEKSNKEAIAAGRKKDKDLAKEGFIDDTTQTIHYKEGGEDVYVVVSDPTVASILKNPDNYAEHGHTVSGLVAAANTISRLYRLGTTGLNPLSLVRNVLRDPLQATLTQGFNPLTANLSPEVFYHTLRQYGLDDATITNVTTKLQQWAGQTTMTAALREIGGETPGTASYRTKAEGYIKRFNRKVTGSKIFKTLEAPMEAWESSFRNQVAQQSFTKAMKRTGGDIDKSLASAMFDSANATTDFSHAIGKFQNSISTVPYLSSAINGTASFWRLFNMDPLGMVGRLTAGFMVPVMAVTSWNLGNEERRKAYLDLPEWFRDGHLILVDLEGNIYATPIPDEVGQFYGVARRLIEYTNEANQYSIPSILAQGAFGFLPVDVDGYFNPDGSLNLTRGVGQMVNTFSPQAITAIYEWAFQEKLFTGQDISDYSTLNRIVNLTSNIFGSYTTNVINDFGYLLGASSGTIVGNSTMENLARDLFGLGFHDADNQFMELIGNPSSIDENGKEKKATGLFAESEKIAKQIEYLEKQVAFAGTEEEKQALYKQEEELIENFGQRVANLINNYMQLYSITGGLEDWRKKKLIQILGMGGAVSTAAPGSYQKSSAQQASLDEYALGRRRYVDLGLPTNPTIEALTPNKNGNLTNTIDLQAAVDSFYGTTKQATQDYLNAIENSDLKATRDKFYAAIQAVYDRADELGVDPDYDLIEKIQARYLQSVDAVLIPIINQYGVSILNNNDFIDAVRRQVNGMIPSDDWRQSVRNAKKFLSSKDYPTATVDVKKWLKERYSSGMKNRNIDSDPEVATRLDSIAKDIDSGNYGSARGKIQDMINGINSSSFYISSTDYEKLLEYKNMLK